MSVRNMRILKEDIWPYRYANTRFDVNLCLLMSLAQSLFAWQTPLYMD